MSKRPNRDINTPVVVTCSASDWLHLLLVAASGRETLLECEGVLLEKEHVRGQVEAIDRAMSSISRALATVDHIDL